MYLDAVRQITESELAVTSGAAVKGSCVFDPWKDWHPSVISHHGKMCCEIAREWITSTDFSSLGGGDLLAGPRWLRHVFKWGGSTYPIHWCEAVKKKELDCGALAALAHEVFTIRGVKSYRAQLVQRYSRVATESWTHSWKESGASMRWVNDDVIYHEGCAVEVRDGEVKVWDASAGWWIDPKTGDGYGALLAIRLTAATETRDLIWGHHRITPNEWQTVT
jgi:hypothetical protein